MQKSIELLNKLKECIDKKSLKIDEFPQKDVIEMVLAEYNQWLTEKIHLLGEYMGIYDSLIGIAVSRNDYEQLSGVLSGLIGDMKGDPLGALEEMENLRQLRDDMIVNSYAQKAKEVYDKYYMYQIESGRVPFEGRGVIYTVITGGYDTLREPVYYSPKFDYICFTDNNELQAKAWNIRYIENEDRLDNVRLARKHKILCHEILKEYDYSIYIDGKIQICGDLAQYIKRYSKGSSILCFPHFTRECAYEEGIACIQALKDDADLIIHQMKEYEQEGYPPNAGLIDSACMVRQHRDENMQKVMECWWQEVKEKSRRDQLSFGYACWKNNFHYDLSDLFIYNNEFIRKRRDREAPY